MHGEPGGLQTVELRVFRHPRHNSRANQASGKQEADDPETGMPHRHAALQVVVDPGSI
jgi:hypothetical protein